LLARRSLAAPFAADRRGEPTPLHRSAGDGELLAALQPQVGEVTEGVVVVVTDVGGRDFVGRNVVAQLDARTPVEVLPVQLVAHQLRILGEEENAPRQVNRAGKLRDAPGAQ